MAMKENLMFLRKEQGLSQIELAEELDVSRQAVSTWETGANAPSMEKLKQLCKLYGVTMDDLMGDHEAGWWEKRKEQPEPAVVAEAPKGRRLDRKWVALLCAVALVGACVGVLVYREIQRADRVIRQSEMTTDILPIDELDGYFSFSPVED